MSLEQVLGLKACGKSSSRHLADFLVVVFLKNAKSLREINIWPF